MNTQKYMIASIGAAVWIFVYGYVVYALLLADYFAGITVAGLMRPEAEQMLVPIALGCLIQGFGLGLIFTKGYENRGLGEGVRFGLFITFFLAGMYVLMYGIAPYTVQGVISYIVADGIMYIGAGVVLSLLYKK